LSFSAVLFCCLFPLSFLIVFLSSFNSLFRLPFFRLS
jgi:hypothetical protein